MKRLLFALLLFATPAHAQNPGVITQGAVAANDCVKFINRNLIASNGAACFGGAASFANPGTEVNLTAVNGTAMTAMRSDAAPALSQAIAPTWTGRHSYAPTLSASQSAITLNGSLFTGGTATTTFPQVLFQPTGTTAVTTWNTSGTHIGINAASGFSGRFLDFHIAGAAAVFGVSSAGDITTSGFINVGSAARMQFGSRTVMTSPADGQLRLTNNAQSDFTILQFGGTTSAFGAIARDGAGIKHIAADGTTGIFISGVEQTAPAAPAANGYRIFAQDNGAGKTQLMVIFGSGAAQQIAIEP